MTILHALPDDLPSTSKPSDEWLEFIRTSPPLDDLSGPDIVATRTERNRLLALYLSSNPPYLTETAVTATDTTYPTPHGPLPARVYTPATTPQGTLLHFHGGGFSAGSHLSDDETLRHISHHSSLTVLSASYRLAPEHPFPAAPSDAWRAALWAADSFPGPLYLAGVSAGANLACVVARRARDSGGAVTVCGQLLAFPWTCSHRARPPGAGGFEAYTENAGAPLLSVETIERLERLCGSPEPADPDFSPLWDPSRGGGLARAVVFVAGLDPLRDDGVAYWRMLEGAGGAGAAIRIYPGLPHAFHRFKQMKTARDYKLHLNEGMQELINFHNQASKV